MKTLGIITTTYNRAYCLDDLYQSLIKQENKDFVWLVVDDGSNDGTKKLIESYQRENIIDIIYHYHDNIGMTASRNVAYQIIDTELNVIIDSDDWLEDDAVNTIINFWDKNKNPSVSGIIALNRYPNGEIIGKTFPKELKQCTFTDLHQKYNCGGDKKLIFKTDIVKKYRYPHFESEKYFPASYLFHLISLEYDMLLLDKPVCVVNVHENSNTFNRVKQYKTCAKSFTFYRNEMMRLWTHPLFIMKEAIHYISSSKFSGNKNYIKNSTNKFYVLLMLPFGLLFHEYLKRTKRKSLRHKVKKR